MDLPKNIFEVYKLGQTITECVSFFQKCGILPYEKPCSNGHPMKLCVTEQRERWRCNKKECRVVVSLRGNTWLENSKLPFSKILLFIYSWSFELSTISFCERELGINHNTVIDWNNYLREVCAAKLLASPIAIGGPGLTVEIDDSLFSQRKKGGRLVKQQWVFGGICKETKECFLFAVDHRTEANLLPIVVKHIAPGTVIISDQWEGFNGIRNQNCAYAQDTIIQNHSRDFIEPEASVHTNSVKRMWGVAKSSLKRKCHNSSQLLDSYLCEFMWRKQLPPDVTPFEAILRDIAEYWPPQ